MQPDDQLDKGSERKGSEKFASVGSRMTSKVTNLPKRNSEKGELSFSRVEFDGPWRHLNHI